MESSLLYHLSRQDIKHNFSPYFYSIYLAAPGALDPVVSLGGIFGSQLLMILVISLAFGVEKSAKNLNRSIFLITLIFVAFNKVYTVQYYTWYFCLLPLIDVDSVFKRFPQLSNASLAMWIISHVILTTFFSFNY